jgi:hypothetical protein
VSRIATFAIRGQFWPEVANTDRVAAGKLAQCGMLEMCSRGILRYW